MGICLLTLTASEFLNPAKHQFDSCSQFVQQNRFSKVLITIGTELIRECSALDTECQDDHWHFSFATRLTQPPLQIQSTPIGQRGGQQNQVHGLSANLGCGLHCCAMRLYRTVAPSAAAPSRGASRERRGRARDPPGVLTVDHGEAKAAQGEQPRRRLHGSAVSDKRLASIT